MLGATGTYGYDKGEDAEERSREGWSCAQAVCCAFAKDFGIDEKTALRLSCSLGGGMGHTGNTCGAVSGALMVIGMKYGRTHLDDLASKEKTYELAQKLVKEFRARNNSVSCTELLGFNISDPEKLKAARDAGVFKTVCPRLVCNAGDILEEVL